MIFLTQLLWMWACGLLSVFIVVSAILLLYRAFRKSKRHVRIQKPVQASDPPDRKTTVVAVTGPRGDFPPGTRNAIAAVTMLLLCWSIFGRHVALSFYPNDSNAPGLLTAEATQTIARPDGTQLHVEAYGKPNGRVLILTHGWSLDGRAWDYARRDLSDQFRIITWDLAGMSRSAQPTNRDYSLEKLSGDLGAVLQWAGKPALLVGHSIGGMINLTYCRQHPEQLGPKVAGLVQVDTTYTNPVTTPSSSTFDTAMQKPLYEPLLHLTILASPLVRAMNWMSYKNGLAHVMNASSSFAGAETREQLDYAARRNYEVEWPPKVRQQLRDR